MSLTMGILAGVELKRKGIVVEGRGFLKQNDKLDNPERPADTRVFLDGRYRHRSRWGCLDESDSRVFMERCARAVMRHPRYHHEMGDLLVTRRVALYCYHQWSNRLQICRIARAHRLRLQIIDLGPFAQSAEATLLSQTPLEYMLPDLITEADWPRITSVVPLYTKEPTKPHFLVRLPGWVEKGLLKTFMFSWAYAEERDLRTTRSSRNVRVSLPQAYWDFDVPTSVPIPSYMVRRRSPAQRRSFLSISYKKGEDAQPALDTNYPSIFEQVKTTDDPILRRAYKRYSRMFVTVHPDDKVAVSDVRPYPAKSGDLETRA